MSERFYKELNNPANGLPVRVPVHEDQWSIDRHDKSYQQVIAQPGLTIYRLRG